MMKIKVLLADDNDAVRRAICGLLSYDPEIELVGEATSFAQAIQMTTELKPQVLILDTHMKDDNVVKPDDVRNSLSQCDSRIVAISMWNDEETKLLAGRFGAAVLLDKAQLAEDLIPAIKQ